MLETAIGIIFILLVFSLFATTIMEIINSVLSLRGKYLVKGLKRILAGNGRTEILEAFRNHPMYKQLTSKMLFQERPPSYMSSGVFSSILWNILFDDDDDTKTPDEKIRNIKDDQLRIILLQLYKETGSDINQFKGKVEFWYEEVMERTTGWYKRNTQAVLLIVGLLIAIGFDADTLAIFRQLSNNPEAQLKVAGVVDEYFAKVGVDSSITGANLLVHQQEAKELINHNLYALHEPLGLGWNPETNPTNVMDWGLKILGWIITALAISLGAPFWFDLLRKVMRIRSSGNIPKQIVVSQPTINNSQFTNQSNKTSQPMQQPIPKIAPTNIGQKNSMTIESYG